ncbi:MAG: complex I NDUFA9 subunit family protein [Thermoanaerobaculia bacterium]
MKVAVTGATGFVGGYVVNELLRRGHWVRALVREPGIQSRFNRPVEPVVGDLTDPASLDPFARGCDAVVHLVGIIHEKAGRSFDQIHRQGTENVVVAASRAGVGKYVQMSAMGSSASSPSEYGRTKAMGEEAVKRSRLDWTIFRPSIIFGPGDGFVSLLARIIRRNPVFIPVIGSGTVRFMPVSVRDVARLFADSLEKAEASKKSFDVGGPGIFTQDEINREIAVALGKPRKPLVHFPIAFGSLLARANSLVPRFILPQPLLTVDQLKSLSQDSVADTSAAASVFGPIERDFRSGIREYIRPPSRHDPTIGI